MHTLTATEKEQFIEEGYLVVRGLPPPELVATTRDRLCAGMGLLEMHVDFSVAEGTDFVRAGAHEDGGITGIGVPLDRDWIKAHQAAHRVLAG